MADGLFTKGIEQRGLGNINLETDTIKLAPMATTYTPDYNSHQFWSDVSASLASGASAITLTSLAYDITTGKVYFDTADVSETNQTFISDKVVIYKDTGTPATSVLLACIAYAEGTLSPVDGTFALTVNANGWWSDNSA